MEEKHDLIIESAKDMICLQGHLIYYLSFAWILEHIAPCLWFLQLILCNLLMKHTTCSYQEVNIVPYVNRVDLTDAGFQFFSNL